MKPQNLKIQIEQVATLVRDELNAVPDERANDRMLPATMDYICQLNDALEYLRRAWNALDGYTGEDNQTSIEMTRAMTDKTKAQMKITTMNTENVKKWIGPEGVHICVDYPTMNEADADFRLLEAAPGLLAALEAMVNFVAGKFPASAWANEQAMVKASAAIAKAKGGA